MMRKSNRALALAAVATSLLAALGAHPASAAERPDAGGSAPAAPAGEKAVHGQLDNGLVSITELAPPITRVFGYDGDFWTRGTLLGNPDGGRSDLYDRGFTLDGTLTQVLQGVAAGGNRRGNGGAPRYNGLFEVNATLDTAKAGLWSGGLLAATGMASYGRPITNEPGTISPVNMTPLWPVPFDNGAELTEYYLMQGLPLDLALIVGRIDATNFLDKNSFANNPESQFLNANLNNHLLFGEFVSFSTYGALLNAPVNENLSFAVAAFDPDTKPGDYAGVWENIGFGATMNLNYEIGGLKGLINPIFIYASKEAVAFDNPGLVTGLLTDSVPFKSGNWLFAVTGEQYLWTPEGASVPKAEGGRKDDFQVPTQDFAQNQPGVGLFYRFAFAPEDRNPFSLAVSGGLGGRGVIPGRPYDRMGLGAFAMFESDDLKAQPLVGGLVRDEAGIEAFYNFSITPAVQVSGDIQYIRSGRAGSSSALVLGTRLFARF